MIAYKVTVTGLTLVECLSIGVELSPENNKLAEALKNLDECDANTLDDLKGYGFIEEVYTSQFSRN